MEGTNARRCLFRLAHVNANHYEALVERLRSSGSNRRSSRRIQKNTPVTCRPNAYDLKKKVAGAVVRIQASMRMKLSRLKEAFFQACRDSRFKSVTMEDAAGRPATSLRKELMGFARVFQRRMADVAKWDRSVPLRLSHVPELPPHRLRRKDRMEHAMPRRCMADLYIGICARV